VVARCESFGCNMQLEDGNAEVTNGFEARRVVVEVEKCLVNLTIRPVEAAMIGWSRKVCR